MKNIKHIVKIEDIKPALDNEVLLAAASKAGCPRKKRLVYIPSTGKFLTCLVDDDIRSITAFYALEDAIAHYNEIY